MDRADGVAKTVGAGGVVETVGAGGVAKTVGAGGVVETIATFIRLSKVIRCSLKKV